VPLPLGLVPPRPSGPTDRSRLALTALPALALGLTLAAGRPAAGAGSAASPVHPGLLMGVATESSSAFTIGPADAVAPALRPAVFERVEEFRLDNGMLFLLLPRHDVPTVAGRIRFRVGNVDSPAGVSGVAHIFEHMAFQGTDVIGSRDPKREAAVAESLRATGAVLSQEMARHERADTLRIRTLRAELERLIARETEVTVPNEFSRIYDTYTYYFNAWTSSDFTEYETDVPANALEVWMLMESERIQHPSFRGFYRERDVVMEERRESEDSPSGMAWELLRATAWHAHPYRLPVIGYMSDLQVLTQQDAEAFRKIYYVPGNAVCSLVGDFDPAEAKRLIQAYFGDIPAGPPPPEVTTVEPPRRGERRAVLRQGTERELFVVFPGFTPEDRRATTQNLLADVLSRDLTSRLDRRLDIEEKAATQIWAMADFQGRYPGLLVIHARPLEGFTNEQVERMIWEELAGVISRPVTAEKLKEITDSRRKRFFRELATNAGLAEFLVQGQSVYGDWHGPLRVLESEPTVTVEEVTALARELFRADQASVVMVEPEEPAAAAEAGARGAAEPAGGEAGEGRR